MVQTRHIDERATTPAPSHTVYALVRDGATWPTWSPLESFTLEREGADGTEGGETLGAVRVFTVGRRTPSREEIVELIPDRRLSYALLSGLPLKDYRADIDLEPLPGGGTAIRWHSSFVPARPGTGWLYRWVLARFIRRCVNGLAARAAEIADRPR